MSSLEKLGEQLAYVLAKLADGHAALVQARRSVGESGFALASVVTDTTDPDLLSTISTYREVWYATIDADKTLHSINEAVRDYMYNIGIPVDDGWNPLPTTTSPLEDKARPKQIEESLPEFASTEWAINVGTSPPTYITSGYAFDDEGKELILDHSVLQSGPADSSREIDRHLRNGVFQHHDSRGKIAVSEHVETKVAWYMSQQEISHLRGDQQYALSWHVQLPSSCQRHPPFRDLAHCLVRREWDKVRAEGSQTMIVSALVHDRFHHAERWDDVDRLINEAIDHSSPGSVGNPLPPGEVAQFYCADHPWTDEIIEWAPDKFLQLASNPPAEYAALTWTGFRGGMTMETFVSFGPNAPLSDPPRLVIDPAYPRDHDPHSAIPLEQARRAVREFCRTGGARPESVTWVRGDLTGAILQPFPGIAA